MKRPTITAPRTHKVYWLLRLLYKKRLIRLIPCDSHKKMHFTKLYGHNNQ